MYPHLTDWRRKFAWWPVEVYDYDPHREWNKMTRRYAWLEWYEELEVKEEYFGFTPFPARLRRSVNAKNEFVSGLRLDNLTEDDFSATLTEKDLNEMFKSIYDR